MSCHRNLKHSIINMNSIWLFSVLLGTTLRKEMKKKIFHPLNFLCFTFTLLES